MSNHFSLAGRFTLFSALLFALVSGVAAVLSNYLQPWWLAWTISLIIGLPIIAWGTNRAMLPIARLVMALKDGADSLKDSDFSISIANNRKDELGELVSAYNTLGDALREERQNLFQRELMLDTVIQSTDIALILANSNQHIVYSNTSARKMLNNGRPINGELLTELLTSQPIVLQDAVRNKRNGLFTVEGDEPRVFHLSVSQFTLNAHPHRLFLFKHLTQEISRQEVATWKNVIRLISHELNNSLAPISSLAHSGGKLITKNYETKQLEIVFSTIEERAQHLKQFIESYARFARLPSPQVQTINWPEFLARLNVAIDFTLIKPLPESHCRADPGQIEQVLINLIKNAHESGSAAEHIKLNLSVDSAHLTITISDQGGGISEEVLSNALLPFYSTKKNGTGLGLPLCREIVEAHGGRFSLSNIDGIGLQVRISLPIDVPS